MCILIFNVHGSVHRNNRTLIYIQQDARLHTVLQVSGGTTTHHQERIQVYLQHLVFVRPDAVDNLFALLMMGGGTTRNMQSSFEIK
jgi:hypothetical protein